MRRVAESVAGPFDAVIAFDNAVPHLLTDADIVATFRGLSRLLAPGGSILISVRDYAVVDRSPTSVHRYGERTGDGRRLRLRQEWKWQGATHYRTTMHVEESTGADWIAVVRTEAEYSAVSIGRLLSLMDEAGLVASRRQDIEFYQTILSAGAGKHAPTPDAAGGLAVAGRTLAEMPT